MRQAEQFIAIFAPKPFPGEAVILKQLFLCLGFGRNEDFVSSFERAVGRIFEKRSAGGLSHKRRVAWQQNSLMMVSPEGNSAAGSMIFRFPVGGLTAVQCSSPLCHFYIVSTLRGQRGRLSRCGAALGNVLCCETFIVSRF